MTTLLHPHIHPPLTIDVEDERVPDHIAAGWLPLPDEKPEPDPDRPGKDHKPKENE